MLARYEGHAGEGSQSLVPADDASHPERTLNRLPPFQGHLILYSTAYVPGRINAWNDYILNENIRHLITEVKE